jgi:hypothetical protein
MIAVAAFENCDPSKIYRPLRIANPNALVCRGYESAYMGFTVAKTPVAVYDYDLCIDIVIGEGDITEEEAVAYFVFNTLSKCTGDPNAPAFVRGQGVEP